eukprot:Pgem_evm1s9140
MDPVQLVQKLENLINGDNDYNFDDNSVNITSYNVEEQQEMDNILESFEQFQKNDNNFLTESSFLTDTFSNSLDTDTFSNSLDTDTFSLDSFDSLVTELNG